MNHVSQVDSQKNTVYIKGDKSDKSHYLASDIVTLVHLFKTFKKYFYFIDTITKHFNTERSHVMSLLRHEDIEIDIFFYQQLLYNKLLLDNIYMNNGVTYCAIIHTFKSL